MIFDQPLCVELLEDKLVGAVNLENFGQEFNNRGANVDTIAPGITGNERKALIALVQTLMEFGDDLRYRFTLQTASGKLDRTIAAIASPASSIF